MKVKVIKRGNSYARQALYCFTANQSFRWRRRNDAITEVNSSKKEFDENILYLMALLIIN